MTHWQRNDIALRVNGGWIGCAGDTLHTGFTAPAIGTVANVIGSPCGCCETLVFEDGRKGLAARYRRIEPLEQLEQAKEQQA